ncbi:MAG TPA: tetratricopeptide repeat protein [Thermoanaerobaculia bacterium]|nr:tetratricopeptide repeat protein [Thermoanaerobaculia bacterium]
MWKGQVGAALLAYDRAAEFAESEETKELVTIRKGEALIAADREGPEVSALPGIVMRRRNHRHVYMASSVLMRRFVELDDRRRAIFYGEIARTAAAALNDSFARATVLNYLGITLVADSQFDQAIEAFEEALVALDAIEKANDFVNSFASGITANLGGTKILAGELDEGVHLIETVLDELDDATERAEACLDLCLGYVELEDYDTAEDLAREGLSLASTRRQIRNANHLLGEICVRTGRYEEADVYFDVVAGFYPQFSNVKQLLTEVNLCSVVNWKA